MEIEHTPVVDDQSEPSRGFGQRGTNGVEGGLDEGVKGNLIVVDEAGHGACGGHGSGGAREGGEARDQRVDGVRVFAHELPEPNLVTAVQEAEMIAMPTQITKSKSCVHTYAAGEGRERGDEARDFARQLRRDLTEAERCLWNRAA